MPLFTTVVSRADITKSPTQTLDQLLRDVPSFNMSGAPFYATDPTGNQTRMRGITNSTVLVLLDGIPIHDPFYSTTQWFKVPLSSIDRVEVVRGGSSSLWGSLAVTGVVNVITKKPTDDSGLLDVSYQSLNTTNASISKNWVASSALAFRVYGDIMNTNGYQTTPAQYLGAVPGKGASSARNATGEVAAYYTPSATLDAFLRAGYHTQNEDIGGYRYGTNLQKSPDAAAGVTQFFGDGGRIDVRAWTQYLSFDKENGAGCYLASVASCNTTATTAPLVQYANSHDINPSRELGGSVAISKIAPLRFVSNVQGGVDYRGISGEDNATTFNKPTTTDVSSATINRTNYGRGAQQFVGAFAQIALAPIPRFDLTLSARYDYWKNTSGVSEQTKYSNGVAGITSGGPIANSTKGKFDPSVSARYDVGGGFSLRGAAYQSFRAPGLNNLYRSFSSSTSITIANPQLAAQTLTGAELGGDFASRELTVGATVFRYFTDALIASYKITSAATAPPAVIAVCGATLANCPSNVNFNTNGQNAVSRGLELTAAWRPMRSVTVNGGYTYTDSHYTETTTGDPVNAQLGAIPKNLATLGVTWQISPRWSSFAELRHDDAMYLDVNHTIPQPAFTLVNLSTSWQATPSLELYAAVVNLTDVKYSDNSTTSAASTTLGMPRAITGGLRRRF